MKDLWNEICLEQSDCKRRNVQEKEYENTIVRCLVFLGWKKSLGEITTQYPVQVGHEKKEPTLLSLPMVLHSLLLKLKSQTIPYIRKPKGKYLRMYFN